MAFELLSEKLSSIFKKIKGQGRLTEQNMDEMLKEIRIALLEADVNFKVVKEFLNIVKEKAIGEKVINTLNPSQMLVKIVHDELSSLLGEGENEIKLNSNKPTTIMMIGLQGQGKTTSSAKLAYFFKNKLKKKVLLAACDTYRPAAIDQLIQLGEQINTDVFYSKDGLLPVEIARKAKQKAFDDHYDVLILDTAGRLQIDEELMRELEVIKNDTNPDEILLLVDAMNGQEAVNVAREFNDKLKITGIFISKLDGDAKGGAALSIKYISGAPIKFSGIGEKVVDLEPFYADRLADRILGMGDIVTLAEKAQEQINEKDAKKIANKLMSGKYGLDDMLENMKKVQKMGSLRGLLKLIPGMPKVTDEQLEYGEKEMKNFEVIINSMTFEERQNPEIFKYSRKLRVANGCGKTLADVNRVLKKFEQSKEMMKQMKNMGKFPNFPGSF